MNSNHVSKSTPEELPSKIHTGSLLDNLDEATRAEVLGLRCMKHPLVEGKSPFAKLIQKEVEKVSYFDMEISRFIRTLRRGRGKPGPMGYIDPDGYITIMVKGFNFCQSQLVYLWFTGCLLLTGEQLDHIDGNRHNDCPSNLRLVNNSINQKNRRRPSNNTSGYTGVCLNKCTGKYYSSVMVNYKAIRVGTFNTAKEAHIARQDYLQAHPELGFTARHGC